MAAGLRMKVKITRPVQGADDAVGGVTYTDQVVYTDIPAHVSIRRPSQSSLEQGLETPTLADMTCRLKSGLNIYERDEVEITHPADHPMAVFIFRVMGVQPSTRQRDRGLYHATLSTIKKSRKEG